MLSDDGHRRTDDYRSVSAHLSTRHLHTVCKIPQIPLSDLGGISDIAQCVHSHCSHVPEFGSRRHAKVQPRNFCSSVTEQESRVTVIQSPWSVL